MAAEKGRVASLNRFQGTKITVFLWSIAALLMNAAACSHSASPEGISQTELEPTQMGDAAPATTDEAIMHGTATDVITVYPFEYGTMEDAQELVTRRVECGGDGLSNRADTTRCQFEPEDPQAVTSPGINVCFTDPSGRPRVMCPLRNGEWITMENVQPLNLGIQTNRYAIAFPEEGTIFRLELVGGGSCAIASGAGPIPPTGYIGWAGVCQGAAGNVLWVPENPIDESNPFLASISTNGYLQVWIGAENGDPISVEVARVYR